MNRDEMMRRRGAELPADHTHMAWHAAQRRTMQEKARLLRRNGLSWRAIADRLGVGVEMVERWLRWLR